MNGYQEYYKTSRKKTRAHKKWELSNNHSLHNLTFDTFAQHPKTHTHTPLFVDLLRITLANRLRSICF